MVLDAMHGHVHLFVEHAPKSSACVAIPFKALIRHERPTGKGAP